MTNPLPGSATVKLHEDGTVAVITAATDNGSGAVTMGVTQIVADRLGIPPSDVHVTLPDTDVAGFDAGSHGSRTTRIVGRASQIATDEVVRKLKDAAAAMFEASADDLEVADGEVRVAGAPGTALPIAVVAGAVTGAAGTIQGTGSFTTPFPEFTPRLCRRTDVALVPDPDPPRASRRGRGRPDDR